MEKFYSIEVTSDHGRVPFHYFKDYSNAKEKYMAMYNSFKAMMKAPRTRWTKGQTCYGGVVIEGVTIKDTQGTMTIEIIEHNFSD